MMLAKTPPRQKWTLAKYFVAYEHCSALFYEIQFVIHFQPTHYLDL
jgi:hypothetical protein